MIAIISIHDPHLHNAMWPGLVGKGSPGAEPPIDLDTMLDLTATAEVDGVKFDGVDLFLFDPHVDIDATDDELKTLADKVAQREASSSARSSRRSGRRPAAARRWAATRTGRSSSTQVRKACAIGKKLRELGIRPYGVVRIDSACEPGRLGEGSRRATPSRSPRRSARRATSPKDHGERLAAEGEICWGGMHSWKRMVRAARAGRPARRRSASRPTWRTRCSTRWATTRRRTASCPRTSTGRTARRSTRR